MKFYSTINFKILTLLFLYVHIIHTSSSTTILQRRNARSLFGNREVPNLLGDNFKPVTFNDILSLREKIANLTLLSDFFRKAIEQEQKARSFLQGQFDAAKQKVRQLQASVNPDTENFWAISKSCGGVLIGQTGKIVYKEDEYCAANERCVWTIRVNQRSKIKLKLTKSQFERNYGFLSVTEISLNADYQRSVTKRISANNENFIFDGPMIIVTFSTESIGSGTGFSLEFDGIGSNIDPSVVFKHFHLTNIKGTMTYPPLQNVPSGKQTQNPVKEITTFVINPKHTTISWLSINAENISLNQENCANTSLNFYPDLTSEYSYPEGCCSNNCNTNYLSIDGFFFLNMVKDSADEKSKFSFSWALDQNFDSNIVSRDTCGGLLNITSAGIIDYKHDTYYKNNERCVWRVQSAYKNKIKLQLTTEGFEKSYDYITVTEINFQSKDPPLTAIFPLEKSDALLSGPDIFVTFYSDNTQIGTGFILKMEAVGSKRNPPDFMETYFHVTEGSNFITNNSASFPEGPNEEMTQVASTFVINPQYPEGNSVSLATIMHDHGMESESMDKDGINIRIYVSHGALYILAGSHNSSNEYANSPARIESTDGIFIVRYENSNPNTDLELQWEKGMKAGSVIIREEDIYVEQDDTCGGVLVADVGKITYKLNKTYEANERCTWTIRSPKRSKITLKLLKDDFEFCCDYLIVRELDTETGILKNKTSKIRRDDNVQSFGSVIFLTFISDKSETGKGFILTFESGGKELSNNLHFDHKTFTNHNGELTFTENGDPKTNEDSHSHEYISTFVISPNLTESNQHINLILNNLTLGGGNETKQSSFALYSYDFYTSEEYLITHENEIDGSKAKLSERIKSIDGWFVIIFKYIPSPESPSSFMLHWN